MSNKLSKYQFNRKKTTKIHKSSQSKFDDLSQSKFDDYICQSCEEKNLQIEYAPCEWLTEVHKLNIEHICEHICDYKLCKWYKTSTKALPRPILK